MVAEIQGVDQSTDIRPGCNNFFVAKNFTWDRVQCELKILVINLSSSNLSRTVTTKYANI